ncbi:hypothetical protein MKX01_033504 [Papaver californicum]|nr:hypothetical protein MKX01_033504 [Papaver californicum]
MAMAALALQQHLFKFSKRNSWTPQRNYLKPTKISKVSLISCSSSETTTTNTAESCVNLGLSLFYRRVKDALSQFETTLTLDPTPEEYQAALYNKACCHAYRGEGKKAAECLRTCLREYQLKFGTILNDPDLASLRALPVFKELQEEARLGGEDIRYSFKRDLKLISEVQAPFRGVRKFFYVAFASAAGISTFFIVPRFIRAIQGGDGAPDLLETAGNGAINIGALYRFRYPVELLNSCSCETTLGRLSWLGKRRLFHLLFKGQNVSGWNSLNEELFWSQSYSEKDDFETRAQSISAKSRLKAEVRFKAEVVSPTEWERFVYLLLLYIAFYLKGALKYFCYLLPIDNQVVKLNFYRRGMLTYCSGGFVINKLKSEGVTPGEDVYIILRLDGRVRRSGRGMPDWEQIVNELPRMDALLSKLEK